MEQNPMAQYLTEREIPLWGWSKELSEEDNVSVTLGKMAIYRQANKLDDPTLELFTQYLLSYDLRAFQVAMRNLAVSERRDGETAFPSLGTILAEIEFCAEKWTSELHPTLDTKPLYFTEPMKLKA